MKSSGLGGVDGGGPAGGTVGVEGGAGVRQMATRSLWDHWGATRSLWWN